MNTVTGVVELISAKPRGNGTAYGVKLNDGNWYGHGFAEPKFSKGDTVSFTYSGQYNNIDIRSVRKEAAQQAPAQAETSAHKAPSGTNPTQLAIQYQASRNAAIAMMEVLVKADAVPAPAKKADKYDAYMSIMDDITNQFHVKTTQVVENGGVFLEELEQVMGNPNDFE